MRKVSIGSTAVSVRKPLLSRKSIPFLLLAPAFLFYIIFWLFPVLAGVKEVFTDLNGNFTLLGNFKLMAESELFSESVINTAVFSVVSVVLEYLLALLLAVLLSRKFRGAKFLMFISMIPMAIPPTSVAILWKTGLVRDGWINTIFLKLHLISEPLKFMNVEGISAVLLINLIDAWICTPSVMIILVAGLQGMQRELKEAAFLFGANKWQIFKDIVLPILKPSITTSIIIRLIGAIQVWAIAVMVLGYSKVPFLVERVAFYVDVVPGVDTSQKLAFTFSFLTTLIVLSATVVYLKVTKGKKRGEEL